MTTTPWFRMYGEVHGDRKLKRVAGQTGLHKMIVVGAWTTILCLASNSPERGKLLISPGMPFLAEEIYDELDLEPEAGAALLAAFEDLGMLALEDETYIVVHWEERQYTVDTSRERVARHREKRVAAGLPAKPKYDSAAVIARDGGSCVYCGSTQHVCVEHMLPVGQGGTDDLDNLAAACRSCQLAKAGRTPEEAGYTFQNRAAEGRYTRFAASVTGVTDGVTGVTGVTDGVTATESESESDTDSESESEENPVAAAESRTHAEASPREGGWDDDEGEEVDLGADFPPPGRRRGLDPELGSAIRAYRNNVGSLGPLQTEDFKAIFDEIRPPPGESRLDWVKYAALEAASNSTYRWNYVKAILERIDQAGSLAEHKIQRENGKGNNSGGQRETNRRNYNGGGGIPGLNGRACDEAYQKISNPNTGETYYVNRITGKRIDPPPIH